MLKVLEDQMLETHNKLARVLLRTGFAHTHDLSYVTLRHRIGTVGVGLGFEKGVHLVDIQILKMRIPLLHSHEQGNIILHFLLLTCPQEEIIYNHWRAVRDASSCPSTRAMI